MEQTPIKLGEGGRIVIPSEYRKALGLNIGDELLLHMENGKLIIMNRSQAIAYVQEQMARYVTDGRILSDELISERKEQIDHE
ncbi:AbrB/MazE/SpoVT family DNA-binding domain-containing protein [Paenibacillus alkaliterrae]|uniref:AbrB/MazE/SpoVT family DNA-binding domain-containing protein n=1 Tax=Paenibacillus alkaliterrae TaxID=320909 RepID=UPI001F29029D|nr:AbrB/MazE/SpoVT family DNA-binding domain-containing protein [Paenibacillus alkaliterrae]MCF2941912.1 AbrB/MazE/SpoVT family DNA-binding domain-containing protein [Paenibacillus alkaliterrae]